jgi:PIN domain nuclease of toxin-antitoxin system
VSEVVLDASALLAFLRREPGRARVEKVLHRSILSAVNLAEVVAKAVEYGGTLEGVAARLAPLPIRVVPFTPEDAYLSASLRSPTRSEGLSLGDRCCLALGLRIGAPVWTAEQAWARVDLGVTVELIR